MAEYKYPAPGNDDVGIIRTADGAFVPHEELNADWQRYQTWLADGGVPDPYLVPMPTAEWSWGPRFIELVGGPNVG